MEAVSAPAPQKSQSRLEGSKKGEKATNAFCAAFSRTSDEASSCGAPALDFGQRRGGDPHLNPSAHFSHMLASQGGGLYEEENLKKLCTYSFFKVCLKNHRSRE